MYADDMRGKFEFAAISVRQFSRIHFEETPLFRQPIVRASSFFLRFISLSLSLCRAAIQICHPLPFFMHNAYHLLFTLVYTFSFVRRIQRFECSYVELINEAHDMRTINPVHRMPITKKKYV